MYCLTRKTLKCDNIGSENLYVSSKRDITLQSSFALGSQGPKHYIFGDHFYLKNTRKLRLHVLLENI